MSGHVAGTPDQIMAEIGQTRAEIAGTLAVLEERLSPAGIWDELSSSLSPVRQISSDFTRHLGISVRDNPIPTALIGLGVCWLAVAGRREDREDQVQTRAVGRDEDTADAEARLDPWRFNQEGVLEDMDEYPATKDVSHDTGERISEGARKAARETRARAERLAAIAREKSSEAYHRTSEAGTRVASLARNAASDGSEFARLHPIGVALGVLGVGAIVAAVMVARSERRRTDVQRAATAAREYLEETADRTADAAREGVVRVRRTAKDVSERFKQAGSAPEQHASVVVDADEQVRRASQGLHEERASFADSPLASERREQPSESVG